MACAPLIQCLNLDYSIPASSVHFHDVTLSFWPKRYGIIGENGAGKTTLLQLLAGLIQPASGQIIHNETPCLIPAHIDQPVSIAECLHVHQQLEALERINQGSVLASDFDCLGNDWLIEETLQARLKPLFGFDLNFSRTTDTLSGGQQSMLLMAKAFLSQAAVLLLDEPTNNLDQNARRMLSQWLAASDQCVIIASHDRDLLNQMDAIIEITSQGIHHYGGNYAFYETQQALERQGRLHEVKVAQQTIKAVNSSVQKTRERHEKRAQKGRQQRRHGSVDKLTANNRVSQSDKTRAKNALRGQTRQSLAQQSLKHAKAQLMLSDPIHIELPQTRVPKRQCVLSISDLQFHYTLTEPLFDGLNLTVNGPERVALTGGNGCGKTTLLRLITGSLQPVSGTIHLGTGAIGYLDQQGTRLKQELTLFEHLTMTNPGLSQQAIHALLGKLQFQPSKTLMPIRALSGGERVRAGLAVHLLSAKPAQLIILDEPTNHLDIPSIQWMEQAIQCYQGALLVVSHDERFLEAINVNRWVNLPSRY